MRDKVGCEGMQYFVPSKDLKKPKKKVFHWDGMDGLG